MDEYNPDQTDLDSDGVGNVFDYVARWKFDQTGGAVADDETGNNNGAINGAIWTSGIAGGGALAFDGTAANSVTVPGIDSKMNLGTGDFSIAIWHKFPTVAVNPCRQAPYPEAIGLISSGPLTGQIMS